MRFLRRSLVGLFLVSLTLGLLGAAAQVMLSAVQDSLSTEDRARPQRERIVAARVVTIEMQTIAPILTTFGEVRSSRTLDIRVPQGGRIAYLAPGFVDGGAVQSGALLLRIDQTDARDARDIARNDLARAEVELADARRALDLSRDELAASEEQAALRQRALERRQNLAARGVGAEAAVEEAELAVSSARQSVVSRRQAVATAEARLGQAEAALERQRIALAEAERRLEDTEVHAGFDGTLSAVSVVEGGLVTSNERVAQLIDSESLEVSFQLSTAQYARLLDAQGALVPAEVEVALDVLGAEIVTTGRLDRVSAAVAEGQTGRLVYATLDAARGFRPGDFVEVRIHEPPLDAVAALPSSALDASDTVLVLDEEARLVPAAVELLRRQGDLVIVRVPGSLDGREAIAERSPLLGAGIRVRPVRPGGGDEAAASDTGGAPAGGGRAAALQPVPGADEGADAEGRIALTPERRAALIAFVEGNSRMPGDVRARMLSDLQQERVPAATVARLEARMGG